MAETSHVAKGVCTNDLLPWRISSRCQMTSQRALSFTTPDKGPAVERRTERRIELSYRGLTLE